MSRVTKALRNNSETEIEIKRSRFIGRCVIVKTADEAQLKLESVRKQHYDAAHNCYAYILKDGTARFSDDGEPSGTAGAPILEALKQNDLVDVLCVVTRYFGGILLGTGGLNRAYTKAVQSAIEAAGAMLLVPCVKYSVSMPYGLFSRLDNIIKANSVQLLEPSYSAEVSFIALMPQKSEDSFLKQIRELSAGMVVPSFIVREDLPMED
ncbi:MAG: YigZ family protein [Christensenellales bacterium]